MVAPSPQDNAPLTNSNHNATSRHKTPPICAEAQGAEHRFGRGGGAEGAGGVGIPNDKTGNLYETGTGAETRVCARGNRLIQKGNTQYAWDADGRMIEKRTVEPQPGLDAPKEEVWKYTWNGACSAKAQANRTGTRFGVCAILLRYEPMFDQERPARDQVPVLCEAWLGAFGREATFFATFPHRVLPRVPSELTIGCVSVLHTDIEVGVFAVSSDRVGMFVVAENS